MQTGMPTILMRRKGEKHTKITFMRENTRMRVSRNTIIDTESCRPWRRPPRSEVHIRPAAAANSVGWLCGDCAPPRKIRMPMNNIISIYKTSYLFIYIYIDRYIDTIYKYPLTPSRRQGGARARSSTKDAFFGKLPPGPPPFAACRPPSAVLWPSAGHLPRCFLLGSESNVRQ